MNHIILNQGKPVRRYVSVIDKGDGIVAIHIEMQSKWCRIGYVGEAYGCPMVGISPSEGSMYLCRAEHDTTVILFHEYIGYQVFAACGGRYSARVCLMRKKL